MGNTMSKQLLKSISQSVKLIQRGNTAEAVKLLNEIEAEMGTIIEMIAAEDKNAFIEFGDDKR